MYDTALRFPNPPIMRGDCSRPIAEGRPTGNPDWLPLVGLIHALGMMLFHPALYDAPRWLSIGESYPVG